MAIVDGVSHWRGSGNPFPLAAVALVSDLQPAVLTIKTAAVREIDQRVDSYLRHSDGQLTDTGKVFVIEGDYGTGKTHLAIELLSRVEAANVQAFYRVAPGGTFLTLYTELMSKSIGAAEMLGRVREFYAEIVADTLRERPFMEELIKRLKRDDADPQFIIDSYGLSEGALRDELRKRLSLVTSDEAFSRALMMLLQRDLNPLAWDWFTGQTPSQVLVERGVDEPIQTDVRAMEALGVIAQLYGRNNRRFVLVIDEMEKLALAWDSSDRTKVQAFKKMLEVFHRAGALLVICGLSDIFTVLPRDPDRIDAFIHPSLLTDDDVRSYIEAVQEDAHGRRELLPFGEESVKYLVYLTGGVARDVLRLCYDAYEQAAETGGEVTPSVINAVASTRSPDGGVEMVRGEIDRLLFEQGRLAERHQLLGDPPEVTADFWIPAGGDDGRGCAILLSDSILEEQDTARLGERLTAIKSAPGGPVAILVVNGYLPAGLREPLTEALAGDPLIVYSGRTFDRDFIVAVDAAIVRAGPAPAADEAAAAGSSALRVLHQETERLARQQASAMRLMQDLAGQTEERLNVIQRTLDGIARPSRQEGPSQPAELSAELEDMFSMARQSLAAYGDVRKFVDETFEVAAQEPGARFSLTHRLREPELFSAIGVAAFLADLLGSFGESVKTWLGAVGSFSGEGPTAAERKQLSGICRTYDSLYLVTPLYRLDPLPDMTSVAGSEQETRARVGRTTRREALRGAFEGLGDRVYAATIKLVSDRAERRD
jgi:hypothetical protein